MSSDRIDVVNEMITVIIGGVTYSLFLSDIQAHKDCYFANAIKDVWNNSNQPVNIDRDGKLFQHVYAYLYNCRNKLPFVATGSLALLVSVRVEADYYNFPELVALYDKACQKELHRWCERLPLSVMCDAYALASYSDGPLSDLEELVKTEVYPDCLSGTLEPIHNEPSVLDNAKAVAKCHKSPAVLEPNVGKNVFQVNYIANYEDFLYDLSEALPVLPGVPCVLTDWHVFGISEEGYLRSNPIGAHCPNRVGTIVYILNSPYTGGMITVTRNGVSKSITKPGEYITYHCDYARDISTVTSGTLLFAEFVVERHLAAGDPYGGLLRPRLSPYQTLPDPHVLLHAVQKELNDANSSGHRASVVLCLSMLYPIVEFDPTSLSLETDPDVLTDRDAVLYQSIKDAFEVALVVVCVQRYADIASGCILASPVTASTSVGTRTKIIAPFHNFCEPFTMKDHANQSSEQYTTLYTAMYITAK